MKVAVVTGGGRGLGRAFAQALAAAGYAVAVMARTKAELAETVALIEWSGGKASAFPGDVTDAAAVDRAFTDIERSLGPVHLLVNNAGVVGPLGPFTQSDVGAWWRTLEVNLHGQILCAHRALPGMIARRRGRIVNIASGGGATMLPYFSAYVTSKTAALIEDVTEPRQPGPALERPAALLVALAFGKADVLSGRYMYPPDDLDRLIEEAREIEARKLYSLQVQRL